MSAATNGPTLVIENVATSFGGVKVLTDVGVSVGTGRGVSLIGSNGSGKTTLFNIVTRLIDADSGTFCFNGEDLTKRPAHPGSPGTRRPDFPAHRPLPRPDRAVERRASARHDGWPRATVGSFARLKQSLVHRPGGRPARPRTPPRLAERVSPSRSIAHREGARAVHRERKLRPHALVAVRGDNRGSMRSVPSTVRSLERRSWSRCPSSRKDLNEVNEIVIGGVVVLAMLAMRSGLAGLPNLALGAVRRRRKTAPTDLPSGRETSHA